MSSTVLVTGATGFIGTWVCRRLAVQEGVRVVALVRAGSDEAAAWRLRRAWWDMPELVAAVGDRVEARAGDTGRPGLGLAPAAADDLARRVTHVLHSAADVRGFAPLDELRRTNVEGTRQVIEFSRRVQQAGGLAMLGHVSTSYVAGCRRGEVPEAALTDAHGFVSPYERSKFEAEQLVAEARAELPIAVLRPGMVVGDSKTGAVRAFNTIYTPLRLYMAGRLRFLPGDPGMQLNVVPVDYVAEAISRLMFLPAAAGLNFHLVGPPELRPVAAEALAVTRLWARRHLGVRLPGVVFLPLPRALVVRDRSRSRVPENGRLGPLVDLLPYFFEDRLFRVDNVERLLGRYEPDWWKILPRMLEYAVSRGFLHATDRTVHEQALVRMASRSRPVEYIDIMAHGAEKHPGRDIRVLAQRAAAGLAAFGVRRGDRVGIVGYNGTRYLALDVALGLIGAVSVPFYCTSPVPDIARLVEQTGVKVLLVGCPQLLVRPDEFGPGVTVISFCRDPAPERIVSWERLLESGTGQPERPAVEMTDAATIRFTSGTTGAARPVVFTHGQLRWMAETVAGLLPWHARSRPASYLSFLPMSHVVEGILGTYSAYYVPARLRVLFLEDIRGVAAALRRARPSVFFAVPRVFEKLREAFGRSRLAGRLGRRLARAVVLRRSGLDRCAMLIAGSAPVSIELLEWFRRLGIEVHNAYGLTEAPLVTMNRRGHNRIGTAGPPLPETELRIAPDGELLVRGPQVATGAAVDGWLRTGDLGRLDEHGCLVITGRKKELIVTAYGKNVHPGRVEDGLRQVPGVAEALVVGDDRPYCAALLWVKPGWSVAQATGLDREVRAANERLSRPERVRRWAVLANDLAVERGDLTANYKLRRRAVAERLRDTIDALYAGGAVPGALHKGHEEAGPEA